MKSQITLFIILGIILLMIIGSVTFIFVKKAPVNTVEQTTNLGVDAFVRKCVSDLGSEAVRKLGEHGGYIIPEDVNLSGRTLRSAMPVTDGDLVQVGTAKVPLWIHQAQPDPCTDCRVVSNQPTLREMEEQIEMYVEALLDKCTNNFEAFKKEGFVVTAGERRFRAEIVKDGVIIHLDYPITVARGTEESKTEEYVVRIPANVLAAYYLATSITAFQYQNYYLEELLMHFISGYSGVPNRARIPPISYVEEGFNTQTWTKPVVEERIKKNILGRNIPLIRVLRTKDVAGTPDMLTPDVSDIAWPDQRVNVFYDPSWKIYFDIRPKAGMLLSPSTHTQKFFLHLVPTSKLNFYEFYYTISYPVVVRIEDTKSFDKKGYVFQFGLEGNLKDNKNLLDFNRGEGTIGAFSENAFDVKGVFAEKNTPVKCQKNGSMYACPLTGDVFDFDVECAQNCQQQVQKQPIDLSTVDVRFCDEDQKVTGNVTFVVKDSLRKEKGIFIPVKDASITFGCGHFKECVVGATDNSGVLTTKLPLCMGGGYVLTEAEDYLSIATILGNVPPRLEATHTIRLNPILKKNVTIKTIRVANLFQGKDLVAGYAQQLLTFLGIAERQLNQSAPELTPFGPEGGLFDTDQWAEMLHRLDAVENTLRPVLSLTRIKHYYEMNPQQVRMFARDTQQAALALTKDGLTNITDEVVKDAGIWDSFDASVPQTIYDDLSKIRDNVNYYVGNELADNVVRQRKKAENVLDFQQVVGTILKKREKNEQVVPTSAIDQQGVGKSELRLTPGEYEGNLQLLNHKPFSLRTIGGAPSALYDGGPMGGLDVNGSTAWHISSDMLLHDSLLVAYVFVLDDFTSIEDLGELQALKEYKERYARYVVPEIIQQ